MRDSFVFYRTFYDSVKDLDVEVRDEFFRACFEYSFYDNDISGEISPYAAALFTMAQRNIDESMKRYDTSRIHAENGKLGGRPKSDAHTPPENQIKTKSKPNGNQTETKSKPNTNQTETKRKPNETLNVNVDVDVDVDENDNVNVDDNVNENVDVDENVCPTDTREGDTHAGSKPGFELLNEPAETKPAPRTSSKFDEKAYNAFIDEFKIHVVETKIWQHSKLEEMDFKAVAQAYRMSRKWLQTNPQARFMSFVVDNYEKIVNGYYTDKPEQKKAGEEVDDILTAMLAEDYAKEGKNGRG